MRLHRLELKEPYFEDMLNGPKTFEVRRERPDRVFEAGDLIEFHSLEEPGRTFTRRVRYVLRGMGWYGVPDDIAVLALDPVDRRERFQEMARLGRAAE